MTLITMPMKVAKESFQLKLIDLDASLLKGLAKKLITSELLPPKFNTLRLFSSFSLLSAW